MVLHSALEVIIEIKVLNVVALALQWRCMLCRALCSISPMRASRSAPGHRCRCEDRAPPYGGVHIFFLSMRLPEVYIFSLSVRESILHFVKDRAFQDPGISHQTDEGAIFLA